MELVLTCKQRLELMSLIEVTCRGKKKDPKRRRGSDVMKIVGFSEEERALYESRPTWSPAPIRNEAAIRTAQDTTVDLSVEDARWIESIMDEGFTNLGPMDDAWIDDLETKLAAVSEKK